MMFIFYLFFFVPHLKNQEFSAIDVRAECGQVLNAGNEITGFRCKCRNGFVEKADFLRKLQFRCEESSCSPPCLADRALCSGTICECRFGYTDVTGAADGSGLLFVVFYS